MTDEIAFIGFVVLGILSLIWGVHGVLNRKKHNIHYFVFSIIQILGGIICFYAVFLFLIQKGIIK